MINYAHRGASSEFPENTMLAFKKAIEMKADGIELDVHKTADGKLVVIHDEDVQRTFRGKGQIKDLTLDQIQDLDCRQQIWETNFECKAPELEEVMKLVKENNIKLNIEIKTDIIQYDGIEEDVVKLIEKLEMVDSVLISSFHSESLVKVKEINKNIKTGFLYFKPMDNAIEHAKSLGADALHPSLLSGITPEFVQEVKNAGLDINVYTINDPVYMRKLIEAGVTGIFTDYPELFNEVNSEF
ncbi:MAG: glycerophosphodiester phosphodiesterase [Epulopiscium sp. Nele67-Bin005]|nr:MAG: glycerophosphodiester phosphodiesterase [Epulopiscium sp. Nele67-Bin005]